MLLGFHGATTMTSDLETDVAVSAYAGFKALEAVGRQSGSLPDESLAGRS